jgi:dihydroorotase-like cyclic amidohydrolase
MESCNKDRKDREGQKLSDDRIWLFTTDAPHTIEEKAKALYFQSMSGAPMVACPYIMLELRGLIS